MLSSFSNRKILERCPSIGSSSVEMALKKLKNAQVIKTIGTGCKVIAAEQIFDRHVTIIRALDFYGAGIIFQRD